MMARAQGQIPQMATPGPSQVPQNGAHAVAANNAMAAGVAGRVNVPNQLAMPGQPRARMPMAPPANGVGGVAAHMAGGLVPPIQMNGIPQAQLQALQQQQMGMAPQPNHNLMIQARLIAEQQRLAVGAQQQAAQAAQQQHGAHQGSPQMTHANPALHNSPPNVRAVMNGLPNQTFLNNAQLMMNASFNAAAANGTLGTPPTGGLQRPTVPASSSPRPPMAGLASAQQQQQQAMNANLVSHMTALEATLRQKNPSWTPEQVRQQATEHMTRAMIAQHQRQSALNAATSAAAAAAMAGAAGLGGGGSAAANMAALGGLSGVSPTMAAAVANGVGLPAATGPHQYAAMLRQQQAAQQAAVAAQAAQAQAQQAQQQQQQVQQQAQQAQQAQQHQRQTSGSAPAAGGK